MASRGAARQGKYDHSASTHDRRMTMSTATCVKCGLRTDYRHLREVTGGWACYDGCERDKEERTPRERGGGVDDRGEEKEKEKERVDPSKKP